MAHKGSSGTSMGGGIVGGRRRKRWGSFGADRNGPLTITHADGTATIEPHLTATQIEAIIQEGKKKAKKTR